MTKRKSPADIAEAIALRQAGFSTLSISQRLGVPPRTLESWFSKHGAVKGAAKQALIDAAKAELLSRIIDDDTIREEAARLVADDLAHIAIIRQKAHRAAELLEPANLHDAAIVLRGLAAYSTALKNTAETARHGLRLDRIAEDQTSLPQLAIVELSHDDILSLRTKSDDPLESGHPAPAFETCEE